MKKIILVIISIISLYGCASQQDNIFALKEQCSKYIETAKQRMAKSEGYLGTYYSKSRQTCVTLSESRYGTTGGSNCYYDELTGAGLGCYDRSDFTTVKLENVLRKELDLML